MPPSRHESSDTAEDGALARRVASGDAAAEAELCRRLLPRIRAWGLKHLRDESAAQDLAQQVMISVLEALRDQRVQELDRVGAFVIGVCKHTLAAQRRGELRRSVLLDRHGDLLREVGELAPPPALDRERLARCLDQLPTRARAVLALTFFAERSADEIATELETSTGNIRVLRHRALEQLQTCMGGAA